VLLPVAIEELISMAVQMNTVPISNRLAIRIREDRERPHERRSVEEAHGHRSVSPSHSTSSCCHFKATGAEQAVLGAATLK